jgi:hypothetical protein
LDVREQNIVVAVAEGGLRGEVREYGRVTNTARRWTVCGPTSAATA